MKISLNDMAIFVDVINQGSFTNAANFTGIPISTVSRRILELEQALNVQLIHRTTRSQTLTEIGQTFYHHCQQMVHEAEAAELAVQHLQAEPVGVLRIFTPYVFEDPYAANMMRLFMEKHKKVRIEYIVSLRQVDLIEEKIDCALVPGLLNDSNMRTRGLGKFEIIYCASPEYLAENGKPKNVGDMSKHDFINHTYPNWLSLPISDWESNMNCRMETNDMFVARRSAIGGIGITRVPLVFISNQLNDGSLVRVLHDTKLSAPFNLVFPNDKRFTTKLRAFIDHISDYSKVNAPWND